MHRSLQPERRRQQRFVGAAAAQTQRRAPGPLGARAARGAAMQRLMDAASREEMIPGGVLPRPPLAACLLLCLLAPLGAALALLLARAPVGLARAPPCPFRDAGGCAALVAHMRPKDESLAWLAMSDWGGSPVAEWDFATPAESGVAAQMAAAVRSAGARFALALGNNFYDDGVRSEHDPRFRATFEQVFHQPALVARRDFFRVALGNVDYHTGRGANTSAQMAYAARRRNWYFPRPYYSFVERVPGRAAGRVQFVVLDTTALVGCAAEPGSGAARTGGDGARPPSAFSGAAAAAGANGSGVGLGAGAGWYAPTREADICPQGPRAHAAGEADRPPPPPPRGRRGRGGRRGAPAAAAAAAARPTPAPTPAPRAAELGDAPPAQYAGPWDAQAAEAQWAWLEATLADSTADFLVVAGHHPVFSTCWHGPTPLLVSRLAPLLAAHRVSVYLAGHELCAEHVAMPSARGQGGGQAGQGVQYHVLGGAHGIELGRRHWASVPREAVAWSMASLGAGGSARVLDLRLGAFALLSAWVEEGGGADGADEPRADSEAEPAAPPAARRGGLLVSHVSSDGGLLYTAPPVPPRELSAAARARRRREEGLRAAAPGSAHAQLLGAAAPGADGGLVAPRTGEVDESELGGGEEAEEAVEVPAALPGLSRGAALSAWSGALVAERAAAATGARGARRRARRHRRRR